MVTAILSPLHAGEFCAVGDFGNKGPCFLELISCRQWISTAGGTCVYKESSSSSMPEPKAPTFVGPSKWCKHSPEVGFLKNTAICAYDRKSECSQKITSRGEVCLLNPKFDSDPSEEITRSPVDSTPNVDRSNWVFLFSDSKADIYLNRASIFRYGDKVDAQIASNFKANSSPKSMMVDMTLDCIKREHKARRAVATSAVYGEGQIIHDLQKSIDKDSEKGPTPLKAGSSLTELYSRVCDSPR